MSSFATVFVDKLIFMKTSGGNYTPSMSTTCMRGKTKVTKYTLPTESPSQLILSLMMLLSFCKSYEDNPYGFLKQENSLIWITCMFALVL